MRGWVPYFPFPEDLNVCSIDLESSGGGSCQKVTGEGEGEGKGGAPVYGTRGADTRARTRNFWVWPVQVPISEEGANFALGCSYASSAAA
jgi:hypothetical protein